MWWDESCLDGVVYGAFNDCHEIRTKRGGGEGKGVSPEGSIRGHFTGEYAHLEMKIFLHFTHMLTVEVEQRIWYFLRASQRLVNARVEFCCEEAAFRVRSADEAICEASCEVKGKAVCQSHSFVYTYGGWSLDLR